jgi:hypothetical protein
MFSVTDAHNIALPTLPRFGECIHPTKSTARKPAGVETDEELAG